MTPQQPATQAKPLVLCADDYAQSAGISQAIRELAHAGRLSATSAMVLSPRWPEDAAALQAERGRIDVGLHLDWTSPFARAAGHGMGLGAAMLRALAGGLKRRQARDAIERQLDLFEAHWHAAPDHVDGHQHVQQFAGIREPLVELLAQRYGARGPWLRLSRVPAGQTNLKSRVIAAMGAGSLETIAANADVACAGALSGIYDFDGDQARYARRMARWLGLSPAACVLMCHPGRPAPDAGAPPDPIAAAREWEWEHLRGSHFADQLAASHVALVRGSHLFCSSSRLAHRT